MAEECWANWEAPLEPISEADLLEKMRKVEMRFALGPPVSKPGRFMRLAVWAYTHFPLVYCSVPRWMTDHVFQVRLR